MCAAFGGVLDSHDDLLEMANKKIGARIESGYSSSAGHIQREVRRVATPYCGSTGYFENEGAVAAALEVWLIGVGRSRLEALARGLMTEAKGRLTVAGLGLAISNGRTKAKEKNKYTKSLPIDAALLAERRHPEQNAQAIIAREVERLAREQSRAEASIYEIEERARSILLRRCKMISGGYIVPEAQWTIVFRAFVDTNCVKSSELTQLWRQFQGDASLLARHLFSATTPIVDHQEHAEESMSPPPVVEPAIQSQDEDPDTSFSEVQTKPVLEVALGYGSSQETFGQLFHVVETKIVRAIGTVVHCGTTFFYGHEKAIVALCVDKRRCASADSSGTVRLWRLADAVQIGPPLATGLFSRIFSLAFCAHFLVIIGATTEQYLVAVLNTENGELMTEYYALEKFVALSSKHRSFVVAGEGPKIIFFDKDHTTKAGRLATASVKASKVSCFSSVLLLNEDKSALAGGNTGEIFVFRNGICLATLETRHTAPVVSLALYGSDQKQKLVSAANDSIKLWSGTELKFHRNLNTKSTNPAYLAWRDSDSLLLGTHDGALLELLSTKNTSRLLAAGHIGGNVLAIAAHPENPDCFASTGEDRNLILWHSEKRIDICRLEATGSSLTFRKPHGDQLALGSSNGTLLFFSVTTAGDKRKLLALREIRPSQAAIISLVFGPAHTELLAVATEDSTLFLFGSSGAKPIYRASLDRPLYHLHFGSLEEGIFLRGRDQQGKHLIWAVDKANSYRFYPDEETIHWQEDAITLNEATRLCPAVHPDGISAVALLADRVRLISIGHNDRTILIWRFPPALLPSVQVQPHLEHDDDLLTPAASTPEEALSGVYREKKNTTAARGLTSSVSSSRPGGGRQRFSTSNAAGPRTSDSDWPF